MVTKGASSHPGLWLCSSRVPGSCIAVPFSTVFHLWQPWRTGNSADFPPAVTFHLEVSWNGGTPKLSILIGFSTTNRPAMGIPPWLWKPPLVFLCSSFLPRVHYRTAKWQNRHFSPYPAAPASSMESTSKLEVAKSSKLPMRLGRSWDLKLILLEQSWLRTTWLTTVFGCGICVIVVVYIYIYIYIHNINNNNNNDN